MPSSTRYSFVFLATAGCLTSTINLGDGGPPSDGPRDAYWSAGHDGYSDVQASRSDVIHGTDAPMSMDVRSVTDAAALPVVDTVRGMGWSLWSSGTTADLQAVWAQTASNAWAVGVGGTVLHWNGAAWLAVAGATGDLYAVWGTSATDLWVGGSTRSAGNCLISHYDGSTWVPVAALPRGAISHLAGTSAHDVWAVGSVTTGSPVFHWDGTAWTQRVDYARVVGPGSTGADVTTALDGLALTPGGSLWTRSSNSDIGRWDGLEWSLQADTYGDGVNSHGGVWAASDVEIWSVSNTIDHLVSSVVQHVMPARPTTDGGGDARLADVWGSSANDVWIVGAEIYHYDGSAISLVRTRLTPDGPAPVAVTGSGADDVWAVGTLGTILHFGP